MVGGARRSGGPDPIATHIHIPLLAIQAVVESIPYFNTFLLAVPETEASLESYQGSDVIPPRFQCFSHFGHLVVPVIYECYCPGRVVQDARYRISRRANAPKSRRACASKIMRREMPEAGSTIAAKGRVLSGSRAQTFTS